MDAGADEETKHQFVPGSDVPIRQYFHSRSNEPMLPGEWDVDSDDEDDEGWLTSMSELVSFMYLMLLLKHGFTIIWFLTCLASCLFSSWMSLMT
jgi:VEFS-Box of polycomb protein